MNPNHSKNSKLLLAIDVGNTNVVLGIFDGQKLIHHWRLMTAVSRTPDEAWIVVDSLCRAEGLDIQQISSVAISSVVPDLTSIFAELANRRFGTKPYEVRADTAPSVKIQYKHPMAVGADRICNAVAGFSKYGGPLVVVDYGTATTFDVISRDGVYLGGLITPGIELAQKILRQSAARLPRVSLEFPEKVIATTTETSIQAGLLYGAVEKMEGLCSRIWKELGDEGKTIITGGMSPLIGEHSNIVHAVEPFLVLEGLRILYERHGS